MATSDEVQELTLRTEELWLVCENDEVAHALHAAIQNLTTAMRAAKKAGI